MIADVWKEKLLTPVKSWPRSLIFLILSVIFHLDKILGPWGLVRIHDTFDSEFGRYKELGELFGTFGFFGWFPSIAGGAPSYAGQAAPYYPLCILSKYLPCWFLYSVFSICLMWIAGYGMYRFLYRFISLNEKVALFGGFLFAIGSQVQDESIVHTVFNYAFPMFFMWTTGAIHEGKKSWSAGAVLGTLSISFLSYPVLTIPFFSALQLLLILLFNPNPRNTKRMVFQCFVIWIGYVLLFLPQLYALLEYSASASRGYQLTQRSFSSIATEYGVQFATKSLVLALLGGAAFLSLRSSMLRRALAMGGLLLLLSAFFDSAAFNPFLATFVAKMDLGHYSWTLEFAMVFISCVALPPAFENKKNTILYLSGGVLFLAVGCVFLNRWCQILFLGNVGVFAGALCSFGFSSEATRGSKAGFSKARIRFAVAICSFVLVFISARLYRLIVQEQHPYAYYFEFSEQLRDLVGHTDVGRTVSLAVPPVVSQMAGLETADGRSPFFYKPYKFLIGGVVHEQLVTPEQKDRFYDYWYNLYLLNGRAFENFGKDPNAGLFLNIPLLLSLNVTHVVSLQRVAELEAISTSISVLRSDSLLGRTGLLPASLKKTLLPASLYVYRLKDPFPRGYVVEKADIFSSAEEMLNAMQLPSTNLRNTVFFSQDDPLAFHATFPRAAPGLKEASLVSYGPDKLVFEIKSPPGAFLVVSNNFDPHWTAQVNGKPTPLYRADGAFQAVPLLEGGESKVVLRYEDRLLWLLHGAIFAGIGFILFALSPTVLASKRTISGAEFRI